MNLDKVKVALAFILSILTGAFLYERSRRKSAEAIADNKEMLDELAKGDTKKASNDGQIQSEEVKREELKKESDNAKSDDSSSVSDFLKKR
jgi:hypothetical protein